MLTCGLTWYLEPLFHRLKSDREVDIAHCLDGAEEPIDQNEGFCVGKLLQKLRIAEERKAAFCVR